MLISSQALVNAETSNQGASSKHRRNGTMQHHDSTSVHGSNEELILSAQPWIEKVARRFARSSYRCEFEEFVSIGMLEVCKAASHLERCTTNPLAYVCKAAEYAMMREYQRLTGVSVASLDAPLSHDGDSGFTLADTLEAPSSGPSEKSQAVNGALRRLQSNRQRAVLRRRFALVGYGVCTPADIMQGLNLTRGAETWAKDAGLAALRKDARLCKVVGVEVVPDGRSLARSRSIGRMLRQGVQA
jgi:Sigma-70 region 2